MQRWCRVTLAAPDGTVVASCVLEGAVRPDLRVVDDIAQQALLAARLGIGIRLSEVAPALRELLELAGLDLEMEGETE